MVKTFSRALPSALLLMVFLSACTLRPRVPLYATAVMPTATRMNVVLPTAETPAAENTSLPPTAAAQASPTYTPAATVQPVPNQPATMMAQGVSLRQGPGTLFPRLGLLDENLKVTVTGKARGDNWIYVDTGKSQGWVAVDFTSLYQSEKLASVPVIELKDAILIQGRVAMADGTPLAGIGFAAFQGSEDANPPTTRAVSMADGSFFLYLPHGSSGSWRVSMISVDCKSPIVDENCRYLGAFMPRFTDVTLPADKVLEFQYSK